ncbi:helix-turn-helix domain-containing protein [Microbacterium sp. USHLN272]|uniref:helix-turn-helix domain-containing protein n=1 Tax=Microbacterium sp. USHLN272 TaxID=3081287 RepID=UPI0030194034
MSTCDLAPAIVHTGDRRGPVLTTRDAAKYSGLAYQTFRNLLAANEGPKRFKQGALNVFYPVDLDAWLATRITDPEAAAS